MKNFLFVSVALFVLIFPLNAQAELLIEEGKVALDVSPGDVIIDVLTVHNTSDRDVTIRVYWEDFKYIKPFDGVKKFLPAGTLKLSLKKWVRFGPSKFTLGPFSKRKINYTVKVPKEFKGGRYGVLFAEQMLDDISVKSGVRVINRVGCLFFIENKNKQQDLKMKNIKIQKNVLLGSVLNRGDVIQILKGEYSIVNKRGQSIKNDYLNEMYLPPNERAKFRIDLSQKFEEGMYSAVLKFNRNNRNAITKTIDFKKRQNSNVELKGIRD